MSVFALPEGSYTVGLDKIFVPFNPEIHSMKDRPASLLVEIQPFVIITPTDIILCDTGLGYTTQSGELVIHHHLRERGIEPYQITKVLLSHLHFDHLGGAVMLTATGMHPSFPNATYYVQQGEYEKALGTPSKSYKSDIIASLFNSGQLELLNGDGQIGRQIKYEISGGHTEFHQVFTIQNEQETYFFGGDVLPDLYQLIRKFVAKYDYDGKSSAAKRLEYGDRSIQQNSTLLFYHSIKVPYCKITKSEQGFRQQIA